MDTPKITLEHEFFNNISVIQKTLKTPKGQYNSFGKYKYRSCEDIVEAVKPLLPEGYVLSMSDEVIMLGDRYYIKATVSISNFDFSHSATGLARESLSKKGMDESQITGTASSYARKYALNGLLCLDDTKDADTDEHVKTQNNAPKPPAQKPVVNPAFAAIKLKDNTITKIISMFNEYTQGMNVEDKAATMIAVLFVSNINDLAKKDITDLNVIGKNLKEKLNVSK